MPASLVFGDFQSYAVRPSFDLDTYMKGDPASSNRMILVKFLFARGTAQLGLGFRQEFSLFQVLAGPKLPYLEVPKWPETLAPCVGYDSVVGREGQRGVDEWVFFRKDQLLPCFLVDEPPGLVMVPCREKQHQRKHPEEHHFLFFFLFMGSAVKFWVWVPVIDAHLGPFVRGWD